MEIKLKPVRYKALLIITSAILLLSHLGKPDVNIMEARNFISAREMVQNKEYLLTTLNNEPRYQKPPLPTWLTALSGSIFGFNSLFFMRLPVAIITIILVFVYFQLCRLMGMTEEISLIYSLVLVTSFYIFFSGRDNQWDMYAHCFMFISAFFLWKLFNYDSYELRNSLLAGLFFGFSVLSKGPVSPYTLLLPFLLAYGIVYNIPFKRKWPYYLLVLLAGLTIGLSWYIYIRLVDAENFRNIVEEEAANWSSYEVKPFYYYWSFFLQSGLWALPSIIALVYPYLANRVSNLKAYRFTFLWTVLSLVLMSLVPEKKIRYLVPVLIPLALNTGFYIEYLIRQKKNSMSPTDRIPAIVIFAIFPLIGLIYPVALPMILKEKTADNLFVYIISSAVLLFLAVIIIKGIINTSFKHVFVCLIVMFITIVIFITPLSKVIVYNPEFVPASEAGETASMAGLKTYRLSEISPEIVWDFGDSIPLLKEGVFPAENQFGLMASESDSVYFRSAFDNYSLMKKYRIDMNPFRNKKQRLINEFYIVTRVE